MVMSIPLATEFDVVNDQTGRGDLARPGANSVCEARAETAQLKEKLERALSADERTRWRREQERGEIDRPSLAKLATSPGYRTPFKVKRATKGRDVAVTLLIDRSGSMAGRKIELAPVVRGRARRCADPVGLRLRGARLQLDRIPADEAAVRAADAPRARICTAITGSSSGSICRSINAFGTAESERPHRHRLWP
jgi:hypothetical protein